MQAFILTVANSSLYGVTIMTVDTTDRLPRIGRHAKDLVGFTIIRKPEQVGKNPVLQKDEGIAVAKIGPPNQLDAFQNEANTHGDIDSVWHGGVNSVSHLVQFTVGRFPDGLGNIQEHPVIITKMV